MTIADPVDTAEAFHREHTRAAVAAYAATLAELLCDFDIVDDAGPDQFVPVAVAMHRSCKWRSRPVHQTCLGLIIDDAMEHLRDVHNAGR